MYSFHSFIFIIIISYIFRNVENEACSHYGVDYSFPSQSFQHLFMPKHFQLRYNYTMENCARLFSPEECKESENKRFSINQLQPPLEFNYTTFGNSFEVVKAPIKLWSDLNEFYIKYRDNEDIEFWPRGSTYVHTWSSPTYLLSLKNFTEGVELMNRIWSECQLILEDWINVPLIPTSLHGIRIYKNNSVLATHVDRVPQVISAVIQINQEVEEDWPLEIFDHNGCAHNITLQAGEMLLYESHTLLHGRPFPMNGSHYANLFVHFHPKDYNVNKNPDDVLVLKQPQQIRKSLHFAAARGELEMVKRLLDTPDYESLLHAIDENGWQPLHEAIRSGHLETVEYLLLKGTNVKHKVAQGWDSLSLAKEVLEPSHPIINLIESKYSDNNDIILQEL